ncbi:MAG: MazG nucleotide pyrophosphohydrolase domain-containing protein [Candidatus Woesearchaeota archaeon]
MNEIKKIIELAKRKLLIDKKSDWSKGSTTYFNELKKEIQETEDENKTNNHVKLEDELGDILWDYLNVLVNLENEEKIKIERVFERSEKKYTERINGIENKTLWAEIKKKQKQEIQKEIQDNISTVHKRSDQEKEHYTWRDIINYVDQILSKLNKYENIFGIPRGGIIIATILSYKLNKPLLLNEKEITKQTLIVDDICDSGQTLSKYSDNDSYTIFYKKDSKTKPTHHSKIIGQKTWIVFPWDE